MDWENEQYVRLYTRDTTNWKRLCWQARSVLPLLLRKVDLAGALDLEGLEPWEAVMLHIDLPEEVVRPAVAQLLDAKHKVLEVRGKVLVFPNHIPAQTATKSDKLRQKESRDRRSLGIHVRSQDATAPSRNVTRESRDATPPSRDSSAPEETGSNVTLGHSLLCSALQYSALPCSAEGESAPEGATPPEPTEIDPSTRSTATGGDDETRPAAPVTATRRRTDWDALPPPFADTEPGEPPFDRDPSVEAVIEGAVLSAAKGKVNPAPVFTGKLAHTAANRVRSMLGEGEHAIDQVRAACALFAAAVVAEMASKRKSLRFAIEDALVSAPPRDVKKGFVAPADAAAFKQTDLSKLFPGAAAAVAEKKPAGGIR
jgi:hypothetical protein